MKNSMIILATWVGSILHDVSLHACNFKERAWVAFGGLPFFLMSTDSGTTHITLNKHKIIEGVVIAVVVAILSAGMTSYMLLDKLNTKFELMQKYEKEERDQINDRLRTLEGYIVQHMNASNATSGNRR